MSNKSLLEILIIPAAICGIGVYATVSTTNTQIENSNRQNSAQIESSETLADTQANRSRLNHLKIKDLDITKAVIAILSSNNDCNAPGETNLLISMATPEQSEKLKKLYLEKCATGESSNIEKDLNKAVEQSEKNEVTNLISELSGDNRRTARTNLSSLFIKKESLVSNLMVEAIKANSKSYRIPIGILVALANANYVYDSKSELGKTLITIKNNPNFHEATMQSWYKKVIPNNG